MNESIQDLYEALKEQIGNTLGESHPELESILKGIDQLYEGNIKNHLTKAPNDIQKNIDLKKIIDDERRSASNNNFYIAMLDIDDFGNFNKQYGEHVGNLVLKGTTKILEETLRSNDFVQVIERSYNYHLHGEEKLAIYACASDEDAISVAERVRSSIEERSKREIGYPVTESIGLTRWHLGSEDYSDAQERADKNMQTAKRKGKNQVYFKDK